MPQRYQDRVDKRLKKQKTKIKFHINLRSKAVPRGKPSIYTNKKMFREINQIRTAEKTDI